jgi:RAD50-interacting protein 1
MSQHEIGKLITATKSSAQTHLHSAQELSLLRHSLADELSYLSQEFVSTFTDAERKSTLLGDIEGLHRNLKELQTVKDYAQIIQRALQLRYDISSKSSL